MPLALYNPEDRPPQTVTYLVELYLKSEKGNLSEDNLANKRSVLRRFVEEFGERTPAEVGPLDVELWLKSTDSWKARHTLDRVLKTVKRLFNWAKQKSLISENPVANAEAPKYAPRSRGSCLTDKQYRAALRCSSAELRRVLIFMRFTGCRTGEMRGLQWEHIKWNAGKIVLEEHKTAHTQKNAKPRQIFLHPSVVKMLRWIERQHLNSEHVFLNSWNKPWKKSALSLRWKEVRKKANLPQSARPYGLRHLFGTMAVIKKVPLKTISELMGHATVRTTEIYLHMAEQEDELRDSLAQIFDT